MTKISAGFSTFFYKKGLPILWFGGLASGAAIALFTGQYREEPMVLVALGLMAVLGYFFMKIVIWDLLVDEVYDCGDYLLVKNRGEEERVMLADVMNVNTSTSNKVSRITLRLVKPGKFGAEITFAPTDVFTLNPLAKNQVAEDLIGRVDKARLKRAL